VSFLEEEARLIRRFATLAALAYANARQREQLLEQALTDTLTGLPNRRVFHERLDAELARGRREGTPVSLVLFDVDDFKAINDCHGHPAGDEVLRGFARVLADQARRSDTVCRVGGEEFAAILAGAGADEAAEYARRASASPGTRRWELGESPRRPVLPPRWTATAPPRSSSAAPMSVSSMPSSKARIEWPSPVPRVAGSDGAGTRLRCALAARRRRN